MFEILPLREQDLPLVKDHHIYCNSQHDCTQITALPSL